MTLGSFCDLVVLHLLGAFEALTVNALDDFLLFPVSANDSLLSTSLGMKIYLVGKFLFVLHALDLVLCVDLDDGVVRIESSSCSPVAW